MLAARAASRDAKSIKLVAVTKTVPPEVIEQAIAAGQRCFGENRVQEATSKWPDLRERHPGIELHLVGPLQSNKVREAVALFDVIETVDRPKLARALAEEMARADKRPRLFVQVNTGEERKRPACCRPMPTPSSRFAATRSGSSSTGLMCIPPLDEEPAMHFALLAKIAARVGVKELSMGMSGDFVRAIPFGATYVRVGTAIFGDRPASASP